MVVVGWRKKGIRESVKGEMATVAVELAVGQ